MICPWKDCGIEWSGVHNYLDQTFHYGQTFREVGRICPHCKRTFVVVQKCEARPWHKRPPAPPDRTMDMFEGMSDV
jgi:hypothetical protein